MASSVCAFGVSATLATSSTLPLLCRTSRQCRCVYSGPQQAECVRRSRKRPCKSAVAFADQALTPGQTSGKRLPILKPPGESPFSTASTRFGFTLRRTPSFIIVQYRFAPRGKFKVRRMSAPVKPNPSIRVPGSSFGSAKATRKRRGSARRGASMKSQQVWPTRNDGVSSETPS